MDQVTMTPSPADVQDQLPLTEATFMIMLSLVSQPRHGYAIMKEVQHLSESRVILSTGTLYGVLKRLLELGWIARAGPSEAMRNAADDTGRPRIAYVLTDLGRCILDAEVARLRALLVAVQLRTARQSV
jgi:DNA-binding PadR family transcriptional regulator